MTPFWSATLKAVSTQPPRAEFKPFAAPRPGAEAYDVRFDGFGGSRLAGQFVVPAGRTGPVPAILQFHGYMSCKSEPALHLPWLELGVAVFAVDARGQAGQSEDMSYEGPQTGKVTQGIAKPEGSYFQALYADTVQALNVLAARPEVDSRRIMAEGGSQGGGLALAAACLDPRVALAAVDNPSLMGFRMKLDGGAEGSTAELRVFMRRHPELAESTLKTLEAFDLFKLLPQMTCPSLWSASSNDPVCPLESVQKGYALVSAPKELTVYQNMGHDIHPDQQGLKRAWLARHFFA